MMSFLVCLNCAAKREIKSALNIPVSQSQQAGKVHAGNLCVVSLEEVSAASSKAQSPAKAPLHFYENIVAAIAPKFSLSNTHPFAQVSPKANIPIYILHEQFLI